MKNFKHQHILLIPILQEVNSSRKGVSFGWRGAAENTYIETLNYTLSHELGSERSERASERMSAAERASEASRAEQANE